MIINWAKNESTLSLVKLDAWCLHTRNIIYGFTHVDFCHVYREHNKRADTLSKERLLMSVDRLTLIETCEEKVYMEVTLHIF